MSAVPVAAAGIRALNGKGSGCVGAIYGRGAGDGVRGCGARPWIWAAHGRGAGERKGESAEYGRRQK